MLEENKLWLEIKELIQQFFALEEKPEFIPGETKIRLSIPSYGSEEVCEAVESVLTAKVTMGEKVQEFEAKFANYIGVEHAVMVTSGSTANLLALSVLTNPVVKNCLRQGDEIITPAITWATTVFPILNLGLTPVLVDVDLHTFNINPDEVERAISDKTKAIMLVHLLGNPCDMKGLMEIARRHNLFLIEDACEAHGAEYDRRKVGSFGDLSTFSFFFSHHLSTIEGGMLLTNSEEYAELAKALRVFGWVRDLKDRSKLARQYPDIDPRYLFINVGYNLRPTEMQGAFGMHQIGKLERFIAIRRDNAKYWTENLSCYSDYLLLHQEREGTRHVWFGYPVTVKPEAPFARDELVNFLEEKGLETRPIMAGNIEEQPAMKLPHYRKVGELRNSRFIMRNSFFFGNHHGIGREQRGAVVDYFREFLSRGV